MIVLIGGNGFIGRHLTILAEKRKIPVTVVATSPDPAFLAAHAPSAAFLSANEFAGEQGDNLIKRAQAIIYLASRSVQPTFQNEPWRDISENVLPAFQTFFRISMTNPGATIVYLSSGGTVYGPQDADAIPETARIAPISGYGLAKAMAEQALGFYGNTRFQKHAILRVSNPVGCWHSNPKQGLVMAVLRALKSGEKLVVYGDGSNVRDYLDADDLAEAILRVAVDQNHNSGIWNVGSGRGYSILEIVDIISAAVGRKPEITFLDVRSFDVKRIVLDTTKFQRDFGWQATTPIRESIQKILDTNILNGLLLNNTNQ